MSDTAQAASEKAKPHRRQGRGLRYWLSRVPLFVLTSIVGVVTLVGDAGAAGKRFQESNGVVFVPSGQGVLRGEDLGLQNNLPTFLNVRYEELDWQTLTAGQSRIYRTNRPDAKAKLCFATPTHPTSACKPTTADIGISVNNPGAGFPSLKIGRFFDQNFAQRDTRSATTTIGGRRVQFTVTRGQDDSVTVGPNAGFKIEWTVAINLAS